MRDLNNLNSECLQKAKLAAKKVVLSTVLASSILSAAGCSKKPVEEPQKIESTDENFDNNVPVDGQFYTDAQIESIIEASYREGYTQGYYEASLTEKINNIMHEDGQLYIGITTPSGEIQYSGISNLVCVCEETPNNNNYYVLKATEETLPYSEGMINFLDGSTIDHNFDMENIKYTEFENYVNEYFGEERLKACYEAYNRNSSEAFVKYDFSDFEQPQVYETLSSSKTR